MGGGGGGGGWLLFVEFVLKIFVFRHSQRIQCTFWSRMPGKLQYNHYLGHSGSIIAEALVYVFFICDIKNQICQLCMMCIPPTADGS